MSERTNPPAVDLDLIRRQVVGIMAHLSAEREGKNCKSQKNINPVPDTHTGIAGNCASASHSLNYGSPKKLRTSLNP